MDAFTREYIGLAAETMESMHAGVDWISCTLGSEAKLRWEWANTCVECLMEISREGHKIGDFGVNGYRGVMVGGSFVGNREDSTYCQIAGRYADTYLERIMRPDVHVSRLDVAVTVQFRTMPNRLGELSYGLAVEADRDQSPSRHRKIWFMSGSDHGYTLYIGSPSSEQRGRMYNKEVQSGVPEYSRSWRYEVVYKNDLATNAYNIIGGTPQIERPGVCADIVEVWYRRRGVVCPWSHKNDISIKPQIAENPSDAQRKLKWLQKQVRPAVQWLIENNYREDALDALGIGE